MGNVLGNFRKYVRGLSGKVREMLVLYSYYYSYDDVFH